MITLPALYPHQEAMRDELRIALATHGRVILCAPPGTGKCLGKDTPVMLHDGKITKVQYIVAGDRLMGPDGEPRLVLSRCRGRGQLYRIVPNRGASFVCNDEHILCLRSTPTSRQKTCDGYPTDGSVIEIPVKDYINRSKTFKHLMKMFRVGIEEFKYERGLDLMGDTPELPLDP